MGTYDNRGGAALHDPAFDRGDVTELEESILGALERAQERQTALDEAVQELTSQLSRALAILVKPGDIIDRRSFGTLAIAGGNARGAQRFEVAEAPRLHDVRPDYPDLIRFLVSAWPLNDAGARMSGRAGNSRTRAAETVTLSVYLCKERFNDKRSGNDILMEAVARAAAPEASGAPR